LLYASGGYLIGAIAGYFAIAALSSNTHDRSVEAAMTGIFILGPVGAILAFVAGAIRGGRPARGAAGQE
jgi:hypothetical protein